MKKYLTLVLLVLIGTLSVAQSNYQDVVYLKNGSIIRGIIIEQVPGKSIKIETTGKNIFVYQMDEIEKITKEEITTKEEKYKGKRKGFIGLSLGANIPIGDFASKSLNNDKAGLANTGLQLNLINFGYLFTKNVGITATWFGAANTLDDGGLGLDPWSYGGIMVGPLFSFSVSDAVDFSIKPMIGYAVTTEPIISDRASSLAFNLGAGFQFNLSEKFALTLEADYFTTKPTFDKAGFEQSIGNVSLNGGISFRLK